MRSTLPMPMDHLDKVTCDLPQMNLMKRHVEKLPSNRDLVKILKEGRLLELVSKDVLADAESDSEEEDAAYAEEDEKVSTRLPKEYTLQGGSNGTGNSMDGTPPSALELATLRPVVGHSVEDVLLLDCDKRSDGSATLPTRAKSGKDANPACYDGLHAGKPSGPCDTESQELGPQPLSVGGLSVAPVASRGHGSCSGKWHLHWLPHLGIQTFP